MAGDQSYYSTVAVLPFDGATVLDKSPLALAMSLVGSAALTTAQSKFGGASLDLSTGANCAQSANTSAVALTNNTTPITVEFWVYPKAASAAGTLHAYASNYKVGVGGWHAGLKSNGTDFSLFFSDGTSADSAFAANVPVGAQSHIAFSGTYAAMKAFVNGVQVGGVVSWTGPFVAGDNLRIGGIAGDTKTGNAYVDDLRVTMGLARYTANFTPPTAANATYGTVTPTTWNPADKSATCTLSNGNLTAVSFSKGSVRDIYGASSGKWYWEVKFTAGPALLIGVGTALAKLDDATSAYPGVDTNGFAYYTNDGSKYTNNVGTAYAGATALNGVVGVKLDLDAGTLSFVVGGVDKGVAFTLPAGKTWFAMIGGSSNGATSTAVANFGASAFANSVPAGYTPGLGVPVTFISGVVRDAAGAPAARTVRAYRRDTGALIGTTVSDATTGAYSISAPTTDECSVLCLDDAAGSVLNDLVIRAFPA